MRLSAFGWGWGAFLPQAAPVAGARKLLEDGGGFFFSFFFARRRILYCSGVLPSVDAANLISELGMWAVSLESTFSVMERRNWTCGGSWT
jgi:hypothetical protein